MNYVALIFNIIDYYINRFLVYYLNMFSIIFQKSYQTILFMNVLNFNKSVNFVNYDEVIIK